MLGLLHFRFPERFGFREALSGDEPAVPPFRLWFYRYDFRRPELFGVVKIMNHCVSYTIVAIGICDLFCREWLHTRGGFWLAAWIAGFWFVRAYTQLYLGRRPGDWFVVAAFGALGCVHVVAAAS